MVPPGQQRAGRSRRRDEPRRGASASTFARRRLIAALGLTTTLALALWSLWPSAESSAPGRSTADLASAALARASSQPAPAVEDFTAAPSVTPQPGVTVPTSGSGKLGAAALPAIAAPTVNPTRTLRVGFKVERGTGVDSAEAAKVISSTLGDARGWQTRDGVRFRAVSVPDLAAGDVDVTVVLASPTLTDKLCAPLKTRGEVSCFNGRQVVLNLKRWQLGVPGYAGNLDAYRQYLVNHEMGHALYHGHVECSGKGKAAPIMLQQSKGLDGCTPNAWPTVR
ncbi:hypothetical protein N802_19200 [Knoellia sinensis KCTC 19936]|uniref:DUF3152 domain-containing protein n=2 Tax=Knoellia TaxID=136099 RepID=A0A0A0J743_9MICO|nr:hypothetical protein N802_19200 [Knoellia sinensis KCTC 19936]